jgi:hypothetical protein
MRIVSLNLIEMVIASLYSAQLISALHFIPENHADTHEKAEGTPGAAGYNEDVRHCPVLNRIVQACQTAEDTAHNETHFETLHEEMLYLSQTSEYSFSFSL